MDINRRSHTLTGAQSKMEMGTPDGRTWYDPDTAHHRAGDPDYQVALPETCALCLAQETATSEAWRAAATP